MTGDLAELVDNNDATAVAQEVRAGSVDPQQLLDLALARVEERNPTLNAIVNVAADDARAQLNRVDRSAPFAGVPFVIKDLGARVAGLPTTRGSRLWADDVATSDSELVARYRRAGFIIVGMTNTPEMGKSASTEPLIHGPTRNPHSLAHSPGGSSGGTAAAVAAGIVPIGHGNDGGGSIRIPAAACGLFGLKPSRGRTPAHPAYSMLTYPLGIAHVLTRSVRDSARVLDATAGPMPGDSYVIDRPDRSWEDSLVAGPAPLRIATTTDDRHGLPVDPACADAVRTTAKRLADMGHEIAESAVPWPNEELSLIMRTIAGVSSKLAVEERLAELGRELRDDDLEPFTRMLVDRAGTESGADVLRAFEAIEAATRTIGEFFVDHDLLLTATLARTVPEIGHLDPTDVGAMVTRAGAYSALTSPFNVTGQPAVSIPCGKDSDGLPIGVQLVGRFGAEDLLLAISAQLERAHPWPITPVWARPVV